MLGGGAPLLLAVLLSVALGSGPTYAAHVAHDVAHDGTPPRLDVWFGPQLDVATTPAPGSACTAWCVPCCSGRAITRPDLFPNLLAPLTAWPGLYGRTGTFKAYIHLFDPSKDGSGSTDAQLRALIAVLRQRDVGVGSRSG